MKNLHIFTDGSTYPKNPGSGGIGFVLYYKDRFDNEHIKTIGLPVGKSITNNKAESLAVFTALSSLKEKCKVHLVTDSQYVIYGIQRIIRKRELLETNTDVWNLIRSALKENGHEIYLQKVTAHSGEDNFLTKLNKLADKLASYSARTGKEFSNIYFDVSSAYDDRPTKSKD